MPLTIKPHTATRAQVADHVSGGVVVGFVRGGVVSVQGQLVRAQPGQVLSEYGVETRQPAWWYQDLGALALNVGDHLTIEQETYVVLTTPERRDALHVTSHERVLLERV